MSGMISRLYRRKKLTPEEESATCLKCQFCCRYIGFKVPVGLNKTDYFSFMSTWGVPSVIDGDVVTFFAPLPCQHIREGAGCGIYDKRPEICRKYRGGDAVQNIIPYCAWYEPLPEADRLKKMRLIEWATPEPKPAT